MSDYRATLNLPKTAFPMKAELPKQEPERLKRWAELELYQRLQARPAKQTFVLHDGPPYANGDIHMGHALNKILKDIIIKFHAMHGERAPYVPGWDCHGMPIEHQLFKALGKTKHQVQLVEFRRQAHEFAAKFVDLQRTQFQRLGIFGDWEKPYITMSRDYEVTILRCFRELLLRGFVYRGLKPVYWCWQCETALAEAEVEYHDKTSPSIYVKFPLVGRAAAAIVIWTTTPWTLPANRAVCVHPDHPYVLMDVLRDGRHEQLLVAEAAVPRVLATIDGEETKRVWEGPGRELKGTFECQPPFGEQPVPIVTDESVSLEEGSGVVHIAPGHGTEDCVIGKREGLEVYAPVNAEGRFTETVASYKGLRVFEANEPILRELEQRGLLLHQAVLQHSYPHCWRCQQPVIFRATAQWFLNIEHDGLREKLLRTIDESVTWHPAAGRSRIRSMVETRPDWCLSRQRFWGVPIPILYCRRCRTPLTDPKFFEHLETLVARDGSDVWFSKPTHELIPSGVRCAACRDTQASDEFHKENDILDVWFDSGVSHEAVLRQRGDLTWPADLYLEGSDQHRGWFQASLIPAVALHGQAPYRAVLTHGFVVDGQGRKMSKSAGNVIGPADVLTRYGADILRWWVASCDYAEDIRLSAEILERTSESYRKVRNTIRFLLGNLADFQPAKHRVPPAQLEEMDRWMWGKAQQLLADVTEAYRAFQFYRIVRAVNTFCVVDLSSTYLDAIKDCLYTEAPDAPRRRSAQTVLYDILLLLLKTLAPILVFTTDEAWLSLTQRHELEPSVHLARWPVQAQVVGGEELTARWARIMQCRDDILKALEAARAAGTIGSAQEAKVTLRAPNADAANQLTADRDALTILTIVSAIDIDTHTNGPAVAVARADGRKCARCWMYRTTVGGDPAHPELCERCAGVVRSLHEQTRTAGI